MSAVTHPGGAPPGDTDTREAERAAIDPASAPIDLPWRREASIEPASSRDPVPDASAIATPPPVVDEPPETSVDTEQPAPTPEPSPPPTTTTTTTTTTEPAPTTLDQSSAHLDPGDRDRRARAQAAFEVAVPGAWRDAVPARIRVVLGHTSWSTTDGDIKVGRRQLDTWRHALYVLAHEWGHQAAFRYGTGAYLGAPPAGFPGRAGSNDAELWSECVAQALVGYRWDNPYPQCPDASFTWTADYLAAGPP